MGAHCKAPQVPNNGTPAKHAPEACVADRRLALGLKPGDVRLGNSTNHQRDFLDAVKSREDPSAPVEVGHRSATVCHLGNIALRLQAKLVWDPHREVFTGSRSAEANVLTRREWRAPWQI